MSDETSPTPIKFTPPAAIWVMRLLAATALAISALLLWSSTRGSAIPGCGPQSGFDCGSVLAEKKWSTWFGVPVSALAIVIYILILVDLARIGASHGEAERLRAWRLLTATGTLVFSAAIWFMAVQLLILKQLCLYCTIAHAFGAIVGCMIYYFRPRQTIATFELFGAVVGLALLVAGQLIVTPGPMQLFMLNGQVRLQPEEFPIIGDPNSEHVLIYLFDYTCPHCHEQNRYLRTAKKRYGDQLAIIKLPVPLDSRCNRLVKETRERHRTACDLARLALAVWRAAPEKFGEFDAFLFATGDTRPVADAESKAEEILGEAKLRTALADPWVEAQIKKDVGLYELAGQLNEQDARTLPMIIAGDFILVGKPAAAEELFQFFEQTLGLVPVSSPGE